MHEKTDQAKCPRCGAPVEATAAQGLCPRCLLAAAAQGQSTAPMGDATVKADVGAQRRRYLNSTPPPVAELAKHFPPGSTNAEQCIDVRIPGQKQRKSCWGRRILIGAMTAAALIALSPFLLLLLGICLVFPVALLVFVAGVLLFVLGVVFFVVPVKLVAAGGRAAFGYWGMILLTLAVIVLGIWMVLRNPQNRERLSGLFPESIRGTTATTTEMQDQGRAATPTVDRTPPSRPTNP